MVVRRGQTIGGSRPGTGPAGYVLIVRGPDGEPRFERFDDVAAYKARLISLSRSRIDSISLEEIVGLLDT
jgi:hypothetical protein